MTAKEPEDLGIKIVPKEAVFWEDLKKKLESDCENFNRQLELNKVILDYIEMKLQELSIICNIEKKEKI